MITVCCGPVRGQGKVGLLMEKQGFNDSDTKRKDTEGFIWEYNVMQNDEKVRSRRTKMTGSLRTKQTFLFAVGKVEYSNRVEKVGKDDGKADVGNEAPIAPAGSLKERLQGKKPTTNDQRPAAKRAKISRSMLRRSSLRRLSNRAKNKPARNALATR